LERANSDQVAQNASHFIVFNSSIASDHGADQSENVRARDHIGALNEKRLFDAVENHGIQLSSVDAVKDPAGFDFMFGK
jgi:hypothetical protein